MMGGPGLEDSPGQLIHQLFANRGSIERLVTHNMDGSIVSQTYSEDPAVAVMLQEHVAMMLVRVAENRNIRAWDPLFVALFEHSDEYKLQVDYPATGVHATFSASTPCGQALISSHTSVVTLFVNNGQSEAMTSHEVPAECQSTEQQQPTDWITLVLAMILRFFSSLFPI